MKTILKKYYILLIISVVSILLITTFRMIKGISFSISELALWGSIVSSTLIIRTIDDLFDYQKDLRNNKQVIPLHIQCLFFIILSLTTVLLNVYLEGLYGLIISIAYLLFITISFKLNTFLKIFIYPFLLINSFIMLFNIYNNILNNLYSYIYIIVTIIVVLVISIIFGIVKRGKKI